ncbi:MAG TPA: glycosyltransferase [Thermoanaerobaculia bacterium]|jgi:glycosyltransferase involved in cell wall biosynthesis|nr:glycosyltransferase [Thermoanaerobaculia bacterium]
MLRHVRWVTLVLGAAFAGAVVRIVRRLLRCTPRIWHGFTPLHATAWMVQAERKAGFPSISVTINTRATRYALVRREDFDVVFENEADRWDDVHWLTLIHLLRNADIWNAYFDCLFFKQNEHWKNKVVFRLIRLAGIRIVVQPHGSDLMYTGNDRSRYRWTERAQLDYPNWDLAAYREVVESRIALFDRFASFILAGDKLYEPLFPRFDLSFHTVPVDTQQLVPADAPMRAVPVIIHAPNHRNIKGTAELLAALEYLKERGFPFELRLIEGVPRHEALQMYGDADIIADQFIMGAFGIFALEGMALGKPVLTYLDEPHLQDSTYSHPLVNTTLENMTRVLAVLHAVPELRRRIGLASRASVERYQSFAALAEVWTRIYRHVWWRQPLDLESTAPYDPRRPTRALAEDPTDPAFWPVPVDDLMQEIRAAVDRVVP